MNIYGVSGESEVIWSPAIVADSGGDLHAFWIYFNQDVGEVIYYARWHEEEWSNPKDIMLSPDGGSLSELSAEVDTRGYLHLAWLSRSAFSQSLKIYYSRAHVAEAGSIRGWLSPVVIAVVPDYVARRSSPILEADASGNLHLVFWNYGSGAYELYHIKSEDGGASWTAPVQISESDPTHFVRPCALAAEDRGRLHLTWASYPLYSAGIDIVSSNYYPALLYSRSEDGGQSWTQAIEIAGVGRSGQGFGEMNVAVLADDVVHLVWNGSGETAGRYHQWSGDSGNSWTKPTRILGIGGQSGIPPMVVDSNGVLHVITAGSDGRPVHIWWKDGQWSRPESFSVGGYNELLGAAITEGNRLHVIGLGYREGQTDTGFRRVWHVTRRLPAPYVPTRAVPTPVPTPTAVPSASPTQSATATPLALSAKATSTGRNPSPTDGALADSSLNAWYPLAAGIFPAVLIVAIVTLARASRPRAGR